MIATAAPMAMLAADCADVVARPIAGPFPPRQVRKTAEQNEQNSSLMRLAVTLHLENF